MLAEDQDPRLLLLSSLDIPACRIEFSGTPIVLLCGGKVSSKNNPDNNDPPLESLRHAVSNHHTGFEIFRPEEITNWQSDSIFKDLISFELELASICSLVVIILESEGALVELGAFSQLPELSDKIVAIRATEFANTDSFINLGILRFIIAKNPKNVKSYPWDTKNPNSILREVIVDITSDIQQVLNNLPKTQVLKADNFSHIMVMICGLLKLFTALKESEIFEYLGILNTKTTKDALKGKLFLLLKFQIIKIQIYSDATFYMQGSENFHTLRISSKEKDKVLDTLRVEVQCLNFYKQSEKHRNRNRAISLAAQGVRNE